MSRDPVPHARVTHDPTPHSQPASEAGGREEEEDIADGILLYSARTILDAADKRVRVGGLFAWTANDVSVMRQLIARLASRPSSGEDSARLDWLERVMLERCVTVEGRVSVHGAPPTSGPHDTWFSRPTAQWHVHLNGSGPLAFRPTIRESIDAARAAEGSANG